MKYLFYFMFTSIISINSFAHGENKPGPNGGFIKMPGTFHTELVMDQKDKSFHVYLLDLEFKNPTVDNSSLEMVLEQKKKVSFQCDVMGGTHYHCKPKTDYTSGSGTLTLNAKRKDAKGVATYALPLTLPKETPKAMDHSNHH